MRYPIILLIFLSGIVLSMQAFVWSACLYLWNNIFQPLGFARRPEAFSVALFVFIVLVLSYLKHLGCNSFKPKMNYMIRMSIVFLLWLIVCSILSPFQDTVWTEYLVIIKYIAPLMLISSALCCYKDILLVSATLMLSVGVWSAQGGVKGLVGGVTSTMAIKYGQMADNNDFMAAAVSILPMLLFFMFNYKGRFQPQVRLLLFLMFFLTISAIVFSNSRGAVVGVIGLIVVYISVVSLNKMRDFFILGLVVVSICFVLPDSFWNRISTIDLSLERQTEASANSRLHLMKSAIHCTADHPVFGVGPNLWIKVAEEYSGKKLEPHSAYLKIAAETGVIGAAIFITLLIVTIKRLLSQHKRLINSDNHDLAMLSLAFAMTLVGIAIPFAFLNHPYSEFLWAWLGVANAFLLLAAVEKDKVILFK